MKPLRITSTHRAVVLATLVATMFGCSRPSMVNIELRKKNQALTDRIEELDRRHQSDLSTIRALQDKSTTQPALPIDRLVRVVTVAGIRIKPLTGPTNLDSQVPGEDGFKVYVVPIDTVGDEIKATGSFSVEAFDLQSSTSTLVGRWDFPVETFRKNWFGKGLLYEYILPCPWKDAPEHSDITLKITYIDELTGRKFQEQKVVKVKVPAKTETTMP